MDRQEFVAAVIQRLKQTKLAVEVKSYEWTSKEDPDHPGGAATFIMFGNIVVARVHDHQCEHVGAFQLNMIDFACNLEDTGFRTADPRVLATMIISFCGLTV